MSNPKPKPKINVPVLVIAIIGLVISVTLLVALLVWATSGIWLHPDILSN